MIYAGTKRTFYNVKDNYKVDFTNDSFLYETKAYGCDNVIIKQVEWQIMRRPAPSVMNKFRWKIHTDVTDDNFINVVTWLDAES